jgi:L-seryl-tRNA(Ser) seleniumtransferase
MNLTFDWSCRSFLAALGAISGGLFAPSELNAASIFGKKHKPPVSLVDGSLIVPITTGLGSTGDIYAELGVTPLVNINGTVTVIGGSVMRP